MQQAQAEPAARIKAAFERSKMILERKPQVGERTATTRVRVKDGLTCEVEEGSWKFTIDSSPKVGGQGLGPDPGVLARAALGGCLSMTYVRWAAAMDVTIASLEVEVQADSDAAGHYGIDGRSADYREVRCIVRVQSEAPEEDIRKVLDAADQYTPYLQVFRRPQKVHRITEIEGAGS